MSLLVAWWPVIKNRQQQKLNIASDNRYVSKLATIYKCATKPLLQCIPKKSWRIHTYMIVCQFQETEFSLQAYLTQFFFSIKKNCSAAWFWIAWALLNKGCSKIYILTIRSLQSMCKKMNVWHRDFPIYYVNYRPCM